MMIVMLFPLPARSDLLQNPQIVPVKMLKASAIVDGLGETPPPPIPPNQHNM